MSYRISYSDKFDKSLEKIDFAHAQKILKYLKKNVDGSENPRAFGKALTGNMKGLWRYRIGNYRVICNIQDKQCVVLALETAHRKDIYN
ncbi:MAG: type II toxin-antitoxin system RelE/ParE family toxin [Dysgonamonadaceae bacterium]|jgi:mRNA interferase RelE/StbE|nr:type II toxin-antitoxin system RelE/ParE family toxin [Dysgonamonadaceae bacterium]